MARKQKEMRELLGSLENLRGTMTAEKFSIMLREQAVDNDRRALHEKEEKKFREQMENEPISSHNVPAPDVVIITDSKIAEEVMEDDEKKSKSKGTSSKHENDKRTGHQKK